MYQLWNLREYWIVRQGDGLKRKPRAPAAVFRMQVQANAVRGFPAKTEVTKSVTRSHVSMFASGEQGSALCHGLRCASRAPLTKLEEAM